MVVWSTKPKGVKRLRVRSTRPDKVKRPWMRVQSTKPKGAMWLKIEMRSLREWSDQACDFKAQSPNKHRMGVQSAKPDEAKQLRMRAWSTKPAMEHSDWKCKCAQIAKPEGAKRLTMWVQIASPERVKRLIMWVQSMKCKCHGTIWMWPMFSK